MIYRTVHWYMFRELLRIFFLTACALTVLLAFGGTFRQLTKEGLGIARLLVVMLNLMPAMLAYAIPVAALFAAVLVYWRIGTDNEMLACRAGGISFWAVVLPALVLGLAVASADLLFVNDVVPLFLQRTEHVVQKDLGSLLVYNVKRQEPFAFGNMVVYADDAEQAPPTISGGGNRETVVTLHGMAATPFHNGVPSAIVVAKTAKVIIDEVPESQEVQLVVQLEDGAAFDPTSFRRAGGTVRQWPPDGPYIVPSLFSDKPKFMDNEQLKWLDEHLDKFPAVALAISNINALRLYQATAQTLHDQWRRETAMVFTKGEDQTVKVASPEVILNPDHELEFHSSGGRRVHVGIYELGKERLRYECDSVALNLQTDYSSSDVLGSLHLRGNVRLWNVAQETGPIPAPQDVPIQPIKVPAPTAEAVAVVSSPANDSVSLHQWMTVLDIAKGDLMRSIQSELHSRGSFALSCLALVLLGAGLGVLLQGRNPLAVFVVGFVPAILLVLLITAGRRMVENTNGTGVPGYCLIWSGNLIIFILVALLYLRLARQ